MGYIVQSTCRITFSNLSYSKIYGQTYKKKHKNLKCLIALLKKPPYCYFLKKHPKILKPIQSDIRINFSKPSKALKHSFESVLSQIDIKIDWLNGTLTNSKSHSPTNLVPKRRKTHSEQLGILV